MVRAPMRFRSIFRTLARNPSGAILRLQDLRSSSESYSNARKADLSRVVGGSAGG